MCLIVCSLCLKQIKINEAHKQENDGKLNKNQLNKDIIEGKEKLYPKNLSENGNNCTNFLEWYKCEQNYGHSNNYSSTYTDCCGNYNYFCPIGYLQCAFMEGCCQTDYAVDCGDYCCEANYPICLGNRKCAKGGCQCVGCNVVNPCANDVHCDECHTCCQVYIDSGLCQGWQCTGGFVGNNSTRAYELC